LEGVPEKRSALDVNLKPVDLAVRQRRVGIGQAEFFPNVPRGGIDAVAADLGAGKRGAVEQGDAMARPRQDERGQRTGGRGADDDDVVGRHPITLAAKERRERKKWVAP